MGSRADGFAAGPRIVGEIVNTSLNGENLPINRRFASAGRWALLDMADRDQRTSGDLSPFDGTGDLAVANPSRPYRGSGGNYVYR